MSACQLLQKWFSYKVYFIKLHVLKDCVCTGSGRVTHSAPKCGSGQVGLFVGWVGSGPLNLTHIRL